MSDSLRAKYLCQSVTQRPGSEEAACCAVYADGEPENNQFNEASPSGEFRIWIDNEAAHGFFEPGKSYYFDITPAE